MCNFWTTTNEGNKLHLLNAIKEEKDVLFGSYSPILTKETKQKRWQRTLSVCKEEHGLDPSAARDWKAALHLATGAIDLPSGVLGRCSAIF